MTRPVPGALDESELETVASTFGVGEAQVRRDHVISHVLAAIATAASDDVVFYGGTALSRTHTKDLRLSEDIDLVAMGLRSELAERIENEISRALRRSFGSVEFLPHIRDTRHPAPSVLSVSGTRIQVQLLSSVGYPRWPTEMHEIEQRYSDAPPARLRVPTPPAFAAAKLAAWYDRRAPRDLYDMWALAQKGMIDRTAVELFARHGPLTSASDVRFSPAPNADQWNSALAHQCIPQVSAQEAADAVACAWASLK